MWEQCLRAGARRIVDMRVTENPGEVAKQPGAYLKFDGDDAWCATRAARNAAPRLRQWAIDRLVSGAA
jgi:hypothetical protein